MHINESSLTSNSVAGCVSENQEAYKRALVEVLTVVMHPPEFTERTGRYAWCIQVNRLLCRFKSITKVLAPTDVPASFEDVDAFIADAWRFGITDDVPDFYVKWPRDLDRRVEESFKNGASSSLGKMMLSVPDPSPSSAGSTVKVTGRSERNRRGSAASSAARVYVGAGARGGAYVSSSPTTAISSATVVTPSTPRSTSSSFGLLALSAQSSLDTFPQSPRSPLRRFSMADFEEILRRKDGEHSNVDSSRNITSRRGPPPPMPTVSTTPTVHDTASPTPNIQRASAPSPSSPSPEGEQDHEREQLEESERSASQSTNARRSPSERPWIPQSYRDKSMPPDLFELFKKLDEVCETADALIVEAEDIDARDEGETRLREWTKKARKCEVNGRMALASISSTGLSKTDEVLYVASTLKLLKSAHVELIEYAESMLKSSGSSARQEANRNDAGATTTANLRPAIRHSESTSSEGSGLTTPVGTANAGKSRRANEQGQPGPSRPSRPSVRRRLAPYVMLPPVPWKWRPAPQFDSDSDSEPKPSKFLTSSITIRTRLPGSGPSGSGPSTTSRQEYHTIQLQRMTDREPSDTEHVPACSECAQRGFSCFGKTGACRRCRRVRKGHCTYARPRGGLAAAAPIASSTTSTSMNRITSKGKGKQKECPRLVQTRRMNEGTKGKAVLDKGKKRLRAGRRSDALNKLRSARARMEKEALEWDAMHSDDEDDEGESDGVSEVDRALEDDSDYEDLDDRPPRKRRRSVSARPTLEPEFNPSSFLHPPQPILLNRANSEPPDRASPHLRSPSKRPTFESLARTPTSGEAVGPSVRLSSPWTLRWRSEGVNSRNTLASVPPESAISTSDYRTSQLQSTGPTEGLAKPMGSPMETEAIPSVRPDDADEGPETSQETPGPASVPPARARSPTSPIAPRPPLAAPLNDLQTVEHSSASMLPASVGSNAGSTTQPPPAAVPSAITTIPTPTSLYSSSPSDLPVPLPAASATHDTILAPSSASASTSNQSIQNALLIASLTAKLDALTASQEALSTEVQGAQAKLTFQAGIIEEVREALRILRTSSGSGAGLDVRTGEDARSDARRLLEN